MGYITALRIHAPQTSAHEIQDQDKIYTLGLIPYHAYLRNQRWEMSLHCGFNVSKFLTNRQADSI